MNMENARKTFILEARELLGDMESALLDVERKGVSQDGIGAIFRAAHTIKGSSGLFGLETIVSFTHVLENMLDKLREGSLPFATEMCALLLESGDHLGRMIERFEAGDDVPDPAPVTRLELQTRLHQAMGADSTSTTARREKPSVQSSREPLESIVASGDPVASENWHISLRLASDTLQYGLDPLSFFQYLEGLGRIVHLEAVQDALPRFAEADPELLHLRFEIQFFSQHARSREP